MRSLLDINLLIALFDPDHVFHERAHAWWGANATHGWASCPLTENGVVRIMTHSAYSPSRRFSPVEITSALRQFAQATDHAFWPDSLSLRDERLFALESLLSPKHLTDVYLLALARKNEGRLATFDQGIPLACAKEATPRHLCML